MTLNQYLEKHNYSQELINLIHVFVDQVEKVKDELSGGDEKTGSYNVYGEEKIKIDEKANQIFLKACQDSRLVKTAGSEEEDQVIEMESDKGHFGITLDPLDGSSLIPTNLAVGTIVSIYQNGDIMSGLKNISQSFYFLFGPLTLMVFADNNGVAQFIYNKEKVFDLPNNSEGGRKSLSFFDLVKENINMPEGNLYSPGALRKKWQPAHSDYISQLEEQGYKLRYSGSFVPDFHQILTYGGIYSYPGLLDKPEGKLRLLFEVGPMAFIAQKAGGRATNGNQPILEMTPDKVDQRTPVYIGSKNIIEKIKIKN
jgi:fructose-1,6-bisphosphatase I